MTSFWLLININEACDSHASHVFSGDYPVRTSRLDHYGGREGSPACGAVIGGRFGRPPALSGRDFEAIQCMCVS